MVAENTGQFKAVDLGNWRNGMLCAVAPTDKREYGYTVWKLRCDCGNHIEVRAQRMLGANPVYSCGCYKVKTGAKRTVDIDLQLWNKAKRDATLHRGLAFTLTLEHFNTLTSSDCHYCGAAPKQRPSPLTGGRRGIVYIANGIDRVNSSKGYNADNVVPCCGSCNTAKNALPQDEFFELVRRIAVKHGLCK